MLITIHTTVSFDLPKEKYSMDKFERDNPDWHCVFTTTYSATYKRTEMFEIGTKRGDNHDAD